MASQSLDVDVMCIQETHMNQPDTNMFVCSEQVQAWVGARAIPTTCRHGVMIMVKTTYF